MLPFPSLLLLGQSTPTGKSFAFDGTSSYIELPSAVVSAVPLTIVAWFNPDNETATLAIASIGGATARFALIADGATLNDPIQAQSVNTSGTTQSATQTDFAPTTWQHAAAVFASTTSRTAYLNGSAGTANTSSNSPSGMTKTTIGSRYSGSSRQTFFAGKLAHVAIWNIALSGTRTLPTSRLLGRCRRRFRMRTSYSTRASRTGSRSIASARRL
jgi:hypothetical protein